MNKIAGISEKYRKVLDSLNREYSNKPFSIEDVSNNFNLPIEKVRKILPYLARKGWLSRIKPGLYINVPLGTIAPEHYKANPWVIAKNIYSPYYIGGWSALEHWDLTEQIFNTTMVITGKKIRKKNQIIKDIKYFVKFSKDIKKRNIKSIWIENTKINIATPSQTIADILDDPSIGGGIRNISDVLNNYLESEYRDEKLLIECIEILNNRTIYKRLGYIIETLKIDAPELYDLCRKKKSKGYSKLDTTSKAKGKHNRKWNLLINSTLR